MLFLKLRRTVGFILFFLIFLSVIQVEIKEVKAGTTPYIPIKWALVEIDTANNGLDNYTNTRYTQDLANIIRSFGFPFDVYRHQELTRTTLQFANGTIKYQAMILERPDSSTKSEPTAEQRNWIKWAIGNGTNALFIKQSVQYFTDVFDSTIASVSASSLTFNFTQNFAGYAEGTTGTVKPTEDVFVTLSSFAVDATEMIEGNYTSTLGPFMLSRPYSQGEAWFLAERAKDHDELGVMPNDATRTAFYHVLLNELPKVPAYILPWQRYGSVHALRIDNVPSPVLVNSTVALGNFRKFFDVFVAESNFLKSYGYPATMFAIAWGGVAPGSVIPVSLTSTEPTGYSNIPSVLGYRRFGNLSRDGNMTGYKLVLYNSTSGGNYDIFKVDIDGDKDWGDETVLRPGQNFTWYCEYCDYQTTAFLGYRETGWPEAKLPSTIYFWTDIPITHQHGDKSATWAQIKNYVIELVDNSDWDIGLKGTDHAWRYVRPGMNVGNQWISANGTSWPVDYAQTRVQLALSFLEQEFGTRVKKIMAYPQNQYTPEVRQALVNLGFVSEQFTPYYKTLRFPTSLGPNIPVTILVSANVNERIQATLAWKYRSLSVSASSPYGPQFSGLRSKVMWLNNTFQTNRNPYSFPYNETSMWVTTPYKASMFYYHSMQMLRNIRTAYWTGSKIVIEFPASPDLENFVWRFPLEHDGKYFNFFYDNRTVGEIVRIDGESVFVEFAQGQGGHKIEAVYGVSPRYFALNIATTEGGTTSPTPGTHSHVAGTVVEVTACPLPNYALNYWLLDGVNIGDTNPISVTIVGEHTLKAVFRYSPPPYLFDPSEYYTIREAEGSGRGYWIGPPGVFFDEETEIFWLVYRRRKPLPDRAHTLAIAKSTDGIHFTDVWSASKNQFPFPTVSLARSAILKDPETGKFKLYVNKGEPFEVYKLDDVDDPADFDPATAQLVLGRGAPGEWDERSVTYPWIAWIEDRYVMLYSSSGYCGLATSFDGESWTKHPDNPILEPGTWEKKGVGGGTIMFLPDYWVMYYDGSKWGYYERGVYTGLAVWRPSPPPYGKPEKITVDGPLLQGIEPYYDALRFLTSVTVQGKTFFYYESGTSDGSVDLRVSVVERARIDKSFSVTSANLGDIVSVTIRLSMELPYSSVTVVDNLPEELSYWGGFTDNLVPGATPTVEENTLTYTTHKAGEHVITFNVKVDKVYNYDKILTNTAEATYQETYYPDALLTSSASLTILGDTTPPTTALSIGDPKFGADPAYVSTATEFTLSGTDDLSGVDHIEYRFGSGWIPYLESFTASDIGSYTLDYRGVDEVGNVEETNSVLIVVNATDLDYTGDIAGQYSDPATLEARLIDTATQQPISGKTIAFTLGTQSVSSTTDSDGIATSSIVLDQAAGEYTVSVSFESDSEYLGSSDSCLFTINKERATVDYTGDTVVPTTSKKINLRATVFDSPDGWWGDLTKMQVTFRIYTAPVDIDDPSVVAGPVAVSETGTPGVGVAVIEIDNLAENEYIIIVSIDAEDNNHYGGPTSSPIPLTVYKPTGEFVTGGGWIMDPTGSKGNFGFIVRYTKSGKTKGHSLYVYREGGWDYIVKSNAWTGLAIKDGHAYFEGKCTVQKYNPETGELVWAEGNYQFRIDVWDNRQTEEPDIYQIRILDKDGILFHEAGFNPPGDLQGGNIVIHKRKE